LGRAVCPVTDPGRCGADSAVKTGTTVAGAIALHPGFVARIEEWAAMDGATPFAAATQGRRMVRATVSWPGPVG
jgi:hypothetical protein